MKRAKSAKRVFLCYDCKEDHKRTPATRKCPDCKLWHCEAHLSYFTGRCEWCDELRAKAYL